MLNPHSKHDAKYEEYLKSDDWKRFRSEKVEQANGICGKCRNPLGLKVPHCHHKTYDNFGHEDPEDADILHERCHQFEHGGDKLIKEDD